MFSVCIPVYRYNPLPLVRELINQRTALSGKGDNTPCEILVYDDASPDDGDWGKEELRSMKGIEYVELSANLGRAAIRNRMAKDTNGTYCILLDADAAIPTNYLGSYIAELDRLYSTDYNREYGDDLVVIGGRHYQTQRPVNKNLCLHWWYGRERESDVHYGTKQGWLGFHSNNFLATRSLLLEHPFPETVNGYGHEDTLWGQQFTHTDVPLYRLDNPVIHLGLETNDVFLRKQHQAIRNLHRLKNKTPHLRTRLTDMAERFPRLVGLAKYLPEKRLVRHLTSRPEPDLRALDLLKLKWWVEESDDAKGLPLSHPGT